MLAKPAEKFFQNRGHFGRFFYVYLDNNQGGKGGKVSLTLQCSAWAVVVWVSSNGFNFVVAQVLQVAKWLPNSKPFPDRYKAVLRLRWVAGLLPSVPVFVLSRMGEPQPSARLKASSSRGFIVIFFLKINRERL